MRSSCPPAPRVAAELPTLFAQAHKATFRLDDSTTRELAERELASVFTTAARTQRLQTILRQLFARYEESGPVQRGIVRALRRLAPTIADDFDLGKHAYPVIVQTILHGPANDSKSAALRQEAKATVAALTASLATSRLDPPVVIPEHVGEADVPALCLFSAVVSHLLSQLAALKPPRSSPSDVLGTAVCLTGVVDGLGQNIDGDARPFSIPHLLPSTLTSLTALLEKTATLAVAPPAKSLGKDDVAALHTASELLLTGCVRYYVLARTTRRNEADDSRENLRDAEAVLAGLGHEGASLLFGCSDWKVRKAGVECLDAAARMLQATVPVSDPGVAAAAALLDPVVKRARGDKVSAVRRAGLDLDEAVSALRGHPKAPAPRRMSVRARPIRPAFLESVKKQNPFLAEPPPAPSADSVSAWDTHALLVPSICPAQVAEGQKRCHGDITLLPHGPQEEMPELLAGGSLDAAVHSMMECASETLENEENKAPCNGSSEVTELKQRLALLEDRVRALEALLQTTHIIPRCG